MAENILWKRQWTSSGFLSHCECCYICTILGDCARPKLDEEQPQMMRFWKNTRFLLKYFYCFWGKAKTNWMTREKFSCWKFRRKSQWILIRICARLLTSSPKISQHRRCLWCLNGWCWVLVHFVVRVASNGQRPQKPFDADYVYFS